MTDQPFWKRLTGQGEDGTEEQERQPNAPWDSYRYKAPSPRVFRRLRIRDVLSTDKKRRKQQRRRERAIHVITEREAVRRVRAWEAENDRLALGYLLERGDISIADVQPGIPMFEIADKLGLLTEVADA